MWLAVHPCSLSPKAIGHLCPAYHERKLTGQIGLNDSKSANSENESSLATVQPVSQPGSFYFNPILLNALSNVTEDLGEDLADTVYVFTHIHNPSHISNISAEHQIAH